MDDAHDRRQSTGRNVVGAAFAGLCAVLVGIGLARFAYTPLLPALIAAGWFGPADAAYLGAANLAGYLAGALLGGRMARRASAAALLRSMMLLAAASFFACAWPLSFWWFFLWRFASGFAGGVLMVLAAPTVLPQIPAARRGLAGGVMFAGVGIGVVASGTLVPALMRVGLDVTWLGLGALALVLTALSWRFWPQGQSPTPQVKAASEPLLRWPWTFAVTALFCAYGLNAAGLVPHMVFLVDFVARGLDRGLEVGAQFWVLFGAGAAIGPVLAGLLADRAGFRRAFQFGLLLQAIAVALPIFPTTTSLVISSVVIGAFVPGCSTLVLGRIHELLPPDPHRRQAAWGVATTAFAVGQAAAAYGFAFLFGAADGAYQLLFALGAGALLVAFALDLVAGRERQA